jgi:hypothetical protein
LKVSIFAWHLLQNILPTKDDFVRRGVLATEAHLCVAGWGKVESSNHLFLNYNFFFGTLWYVVSDWLGFSLVDPCSISDHFVHYASLAG